MANKYFVIGIGGTGMRCLEAFTHMCAMGFYDNKEINNLQKTKLIHNFVALSCGTSKDSYTRLNKLLKKYPKFKFICIDVANGYSENFSHFVS